MSTQKMVLGLIAGIAAAAHAADAAPALGTSPIVETSGTDIVRVSNAALKQILTKSQNQLAKSNAGEPFVQGKDPPWIQYHNPKADLTGMVISPTGSVRSSFQRLPGIATKPGR